MDHGVESINNRRDMTAPELLTDIHDAVGIPEKWTVRLAIVRVFQGVAKLVRPARNPGLEHQCQFGQYRE